MSWFFYALAAPFFLSISNHIDKQLLDRYFKARGAGALMVYSSLIGGVIAFCIAVFRPSVVNISVGNAALLMASSAIVLFAILLYFYALQRSDPSPATAIFQTIPIFGAIIGYVGLGERLTTPQMVGSVIVLIAAVGIMVDPGKRWRIDTHVFFLMLAASCLMAVSGFIFKFVAIADNFWAAAFWGYVGDVLLGVGFLVCIKRYRDEFVRSLRINSKVLISINVINELVTVAGMLSVRYATLLAPLALVYTISGFHPLFVFCIGALITIAVPSMRVEDLSRRRVIQKLIAIAVMFVGTYILNQ